MQHTYIGYNVQHVKNKNKALILCSSGHKKAESSDTHSGWFRAWNIEKLKL